MSDVNQVEDLKHSFNVKPEIGDKLPNPKDVADKAVFYLKDTQYQDTHIECIMVGGKWYRKEVNASSRVILQPVQ